MNQVMIIGNLTKAPDMRQTANGKNVCTFTVAVNRRFKDANGNAVTDFFSVIAWKQLAELCGRYLDKGRKCCVIGELQTRDYTDKNGVKRYVTEIIAEQVEFLSAPTQTKAPEPDGWQDVTDEDLPF